MIYLISMCRDICWGFWCHLSFRGKFSVLLIPCSQYSGSWCMTEASLSRANSCTAWSEHKIFVTLQITNGTVECDGTSLLGEAPSPACSSNMLGSFTAPSAPSGFCKDLQHRFAKGTLWLNQGRFYRHYLARETYTCLLLYLLGRLYKRARPQAAGTAALPCYQDEDVYTRCSDNSWTQSWPIIGERHLYTEKLHKLILESVQLNWYKPV